MPRLVIEMCQSTQVGCDHRAAHRRRSRRARRPAGVLRVREGEIDRPQDEAVDEEEDDREATARARASAAHPCASRRAVPASARGAGATSIGRGRGRHGTISSCGGPSARAARARAEPRARLGRLTSRSLIAVASSFDRLVRGLDLAVERTCVTTSYIGVLRPPAVRRSPGPASRTACPSRSRP